MDDNSSSFNDTKNVDNTFNSETKLADSKQIEQFDIVEVENFQIDLNKDKWLKSKTGIMKNLIIIGFAWVFLFTAYSSVANLQSSLNSDEGLGTAACEFKNQTTFRFALYFKNSFLRFCKQ